MKNIISTMIEMARRTGDKNRLTVAQNIMAAFQMAETAPGRGGVALTKGECIDIIQKLIKKSQDSARIYMDACRTDLEQEELAQIEVMKSLLPTPLSLDELELIVKTIISELKATSKKDMKNVISAVKDQTDGRATSQDIAKMCSRFLG